jgi:hypothetical protein
MPLAGDRGPGQTDGRGFFARWWWVLALVLLVLPTALVVYFVLSTPDVQSFEYNVR